MSDGLSVIIIILIVGIILDGLRRARNARRSQVKLSKNAIKADKLLNPEEPVRHTSEFPSGGARLKSGLMAEQQAKAKSAKTTEQVVPVQAPLELDDPVPMLMDCLQDEEPNIVQPNNTESKLNFEQLDENEPTLGALDDLDAVEAAIPAKPLVKSPSAAKKEASAGLFGHRKNEEEKPDKIEAKKPAITQEILVINLMARAGEQFDGGALLDALVKEGLKFGQMGIFHRHLDDDGDAPVVYSLANIVEPGRFDFAHMTESFTPGVCMFLALPTVCEGAKAYDDLVTTARGLCDALGGELKDENRSALTNQTIEHGRQRVMEFERKFKLSKS